MKNDKKENYFLGKREQITRAELRALLEAKLLTRGIVSPSTASPRVIYEVSVGVIKDIMLRQRSEFKKRIRAQGGKRICYFCMEFLVGRSLENVTKNLGIFDDYSSILKDFGTSFDEIYSCEVDPGLGNGGLGRLAACFMDSLTSLDYAANGYSLLYENGLFKQRIVDGEQVELIDDWLPSGGVWLVAHPEQSVDIRFGGRIEECFETGSLKISHHDYDEVRAVPYDLMIAGTETNAINTIRLWRARSITRGTEDLSSQSSYLKGLNESLEAESITKQLYPPDNHDEGKLLRLTQQYFLVSASLQSIINDYYRECGSLQGFTEKIAIHINDTHPALCVPELMRILMDVYSYTWEDAWEFVIKCVSYTNHTVLPEALECWRVDLFSLKLPRIYSIINEINRRFTEDLWNMYPGDWDRISRMSIVAYNQVRMANLSIVGSHSVNGVSKLHSDILKKSVFNDFYKLTPWKFTNVTNGVAHRRWLCNANPRLTALARELCKKDISKEPEALRLLLNYKDDQGIIEEILKIKQENKLSFAELVFKKSNIIIDPEAIFDVQIKRMHEYKRQLLNVLKIISLYNDILDGKNVDPEVFIFGCKAAPGYVMAKKLIKLICCLSKELQADKRARDIIKVLFMEDYNVSLAEKLIPAADISEQISLAGKEASGTGCMKLMMNGALTLGTLDGANVEILDAVGRDNIYIFGMNSNEVEQMWRSGYNSRKYYLGSERLRSAVDRLYKPIGGEDFSHIGDYLLMSNHGVADPFMCLGDFDSYFSVHGQLTEDYKDRGRFGRASLINTASSGIFSSDRSINEYASRVWNAAPINTKKQ